MLKPFRPLMVATVALTVSLSLPAVINMIAPQVAPTQNILTAYYGAQSMADKLPVARQSSTPVVPAIETAFNSTVAVITPEGHIIGTGVIVRHQKGYPLQILTAWHVAKHSFPQVQAVGLLATGEVIPVIVQKFSEDWDLALLVSVAVEEEDGVYETLASQDPKLGEDVWVIGHPRGLLGNVTKGVLSNVLHADKDLRYYRIDAAAFFGNSGGGLYNNKGELIGIADALEFQGLTKDQITIVPGGALCVSLYNLRLFLGT